MDWGASLYLRTEMDVPQLLVALDLPCTSDDPPSFDGYINGYRSTLTNLDNAHLAAMGVPSDIWFIFDGTPDVNLTRIWWAWFVVRMHSLVGGIGLVGDVSERNALVWTPDTLYVDRKSGMYPYLKAPIDNWPEVTRVLDIDFEDPSSWPQLAG